MVASAPTPTRAVNRVHSGGLPLLLPEWLIVVLREIKGEGGAIFVGAAPAPQPRVEGLDDEGLLFLILLGVVFELPLDHPHFVFVESVFGLYGLEGVIEVREILKEGLRGVYGPGHRNFHLLSQQHPLV
jgi:hypothetical protein